MKIYIRSSGIISPQPTIEKGYFLERLVSTENNYLRSIEPEYSDFINPFLLRKMPRVIKMGLGAAKTCLNNAGIEAPDAIVTGTGHGCMEELDKFLLSIISNQEKLLAPTSFILSSYNMISSQIAILLKHHGYTMNYCHRGFSFERALEDAVMLINENKVKNVLTGGIDENTDNYFNIYGWINYWKKEKTDNLKLLDHKTTGSIAGEGSAFFLLSPDGEQQHLPCLRHLSTLYKPYGAENIHDSLNSLLDETGLQKEELDVVLLGLNGDSETDGIYYHLMNDFFCHETVFTCYKHLCGEYCTSSSFALWLASEILKRQDIPAAVRLNDKISKEIKNVLIYNHYRNVNHSFMLISSA